MINTEKHQKSSQKYIFKFYKKFLKEKTDYETKSAPLSFFLVSYRGKFTRKINWLAIIITFLLIEGNLVYAVKTENNIVFYENFDKLKTAKFKLWATNCKNCKVNFAGVSNEQAFSGKQSFKLDITLKGGSYYYFAIPVCIPLYGQLRFRGKLLVTESTGIAKRKLIELGYGWALPEAGTNSHVHKAAIVGQRNDGWQSWEADAAELIGPSDTSYMQYLAVYIVYHGGFDKETRVVLYLDDFEVEGQLEQNYIFKFERFLTQKRQFWQKKSKDALVSLKKRISTLPKNPALLTGFSLFTYKKLHNWLKNEFKRIESELRKSDFHNMSGVKCNAFWDTIRFANFAFDSCMALLKNTRYYNNQPFLTYCVNPIQDYRIIPKSFPIAGVIGKKIHIKACAGEYEPASFAVSTPVEISNMKIKVSPLENGGNIINPTVIDTRVVKVWWQGVGEAGGRRPGIARLVPELLLKDDEFVWVGDDPGQHINKLKNPAAPQDSEHLQPINISANTTKQLWITAHIPEGTAPGRYNGTITLAAENLPEVKLELILEVYPFTLADPILEYAIYYRGQLSPKGSISSEKKDRKQYLAEMKDLKAHGIELPSMYCGFKCRPDGSCDFSKMKKEFEIRRQAGLTKGPVLVLNHPVKFYNCMKIDSLEKPKVINNIKTIVETTNCFLKKYKFPSIIFYAFDEAGCTRGMKFLATERWMLKAVIDAGGMTGCAVTTPFFSLIGDYLSRPICRRATRYLLNKVHAKGYKVWACYRPQGSPEKPETFRRSYGLEAWKRGEDGVCDYVYQHSSGDNYNDFDKVYRELGHTYPTVNGVIDTVQWEGFREGIDDIRYLSTLLKTIEKAKKRTATLKKAQAAEHWLKKLNIEGNLDVVRRQIVQWILRLSENKKTLLENE
ncbi:MAG: hypothetical protein WCS27_09210 [Victivallaceae bacterium]